MMSTRVGKQAIVVGAGMGGLAAARSLADHFEHVTVLERDALPPEAAHRAGTPQGRHLHALLAGGQRALNELFPGFEQDLAGVGAVPYRAGLDLRREQPGYDPFPQRDLGFHGYSMSRPLIEFTVRQHVKQYANITLRQRCRVQKLVAASDGAAVTAVEYKNIEGRSETLPADLVVDASGRETLTIPLLESIGHPLPAETVIGVDIRYSTAIFDIPDDAPPDWKGVMMLPQAPQSGRSALMLPLEGNRWVLSVGGRLGDRPPGDWDGFLTCVQQLRTPTIYNAIKHANRVGEIVRFAFPASVWRHFERLDTFPRGLLPFGDAVCRFNPVYGQGMSVAAQEACLLRRLLATRAVERDPLAGLGPAFFAEAQRLIDTPWAMSAIPDFAYPETGGQRPPDFEKTLKFGFALTRLAAQDPAVHKLMFEVQHLLKPRSVYRDPELEQRVLEVMAEV